MLRPHWGTSWLGLLVDLAQRIWINPASSFVKWEDRRGKLHLICVSDTAALVRLLKKQEWWGGGPAIGLQCYWSAELELTGSANDSQPSIRTAITL